MRYQTRHRSRRFLTVMALIAATAVFVTACDISIIVDDGGTDLADLTFSLEWDGTENLDLYMTYPDSSDTTYDAPPFTDPYTIPPSTGWDADIGFWPDDLSTSDWTEDGSDRAAVYWGNHASDMEYRSQPAVELINDATNGNEDETIAVRGFPFSASATNVSTNGGTNADGLPGGYDYTWVGVMELYAYADGSAKISSSSGADTAARLVVRDDGTVIGEYELPVETDLKGASIVRINCFYRDGIEYYQIVPDVQVVNVTTQIRSVSGDDTNGITLVEGRARQ